MKRRKIIAFILSISIIAGSLPCTVFADTEPEAAQQEELARDEQEEEPKEEPTEEHEEPEVEDPKAEKPEEKDEEPSEPTEEKTAPEADEDAAAEDTHDEDTHDEDTAGEEPDPTEDKQEADDKVVVGTVPRYAAGNEEAQKVTAETLDLNGGTWVVDSDVTVSKRLYVMGDVTLILNDGCTLTASRGIEVFNLDKLTIDVPEGSEGTGSLVANAVSDDTAIGSNNSTSGYKAGLITINGGNITASGSGSGSGIGGRYNSNGVIINGGTVTATGGTSGYGIGAGTLYNGGIQINGGTVTATGGSSSSAIGGLHNVDIAYSVTISGGTVTANPGQSNSKGIGVHYDLDRCNIRIGGDDLVKIDPTTFGGNIDFASQVTNGMKTFGPGDHVSSYQLEMIDGRLLLPYSDTETVKYVDEYGDEQTVVAKVLYGDITTLNGNNGYDGFYLSKFDKMSFANRVECIGNVKIILSDDIGLNASQGITVNPGNTLEIYGQSKGTGKLSAEGDIPQGYAAIGSDGVGNISQSGMIIINGGEIFASGGANNTGAGIGGGSNNDGSVTINGGNITAIAGNGAACIGGGYQGRGYVVIKGGVISAKDGSAYLPYGIGDGRDPLTKGTVSLNWTDVENDRYDAVYNGNVTLEKGFSDGSSGFAPGGIKPARISGREIYPAIPVNVMTSPGVSVTSSQTYAKVGQSVRLDIDREPLRSLRDLTVKADGKTVPFDDQNDDRAFFTVPVASSSVEVTFVLTYYIGILQTANGVLETDKEYAAEGDTVTLTGDPDKNYVLDNASYYKPDHSEEVPVHLTAIAGSYYLSKHIYTTLVDGNVSTFWFVRNDPYVIFKADDPVVLAGYSFTTAVFEDGYPERNPKSWTIYGANFADDSKAVRDSDEWTAVTSVTNDTVIQPVNNATYDFASGDTSIPYQYYKLEITKPDDVQMAEFTMRADKFVDVSGEGNTRTFTMPDGPINIYAGFRRNQFDISYSDHPNGQITGQADAVTGTSVSVTATPDDGYKVGGFSVVNADPESSVSIHLSALSGGFSNENETAAKLVDGNTDTKWYTDSDHYAVVKADKPVVMTGYILTTGGDTNKSPDRNWKSWTIYGANFGDDSKAVRDSDEWQVITAVTDDDTLKPVSKGEFEFRLDGIPLAYKYYKIEITDPGSAIQMSEFVLMACKTVSATVEGNTCTFTMPEHFVNVCGVFVRNRFPITYISVPHGEITGPVRQTEEQDVTVTADPDDGYRLSNVKVLRDGDRKTSKVAVTPLDGGSIVESADFKRLVDGNKNTDWRTNVEPFMIMKADKPAILAEYNLTPPGFDTPRSSYVLWDSWKVYGANFSSDSEATRNSDKWQLLSEVVGDDKIQYAYGNKYSYTYEIDGMPDVYQYYKIEITDPQNTTIGMAELELRAWDGNNYPCEENTCTFPMPSGAAKVIPEFREINNQIVYQDTQNGSVTGPDSGVRGDSVTVTVDPEDGYALDHLYVMPFRNGKEVEAHLTAIDGGNKDKNSAHNIHCLLRESSYSDGEYFYGDYWATGTGEGFEHFIILKTDKPILMSKYTLLNQVSRENPDGEYTWKNWTIYGANFSSDSEAVRDSDKWQEVTYVQNDNKMDPYQGIKRDYGVKNAPGAYQYYKIEITDNKDYIMMHYFALYGYEEIELTGEGDTRTFTMPDEAVNVYADFKVSDGIGEHLEGHTLSLEGDIGVNFYMKLDPSVAASDSAYMEFAVPSGKETLTQCVYVNPQSDASLPYARKAGDYYIFKCNVAAKEMTSEIKAQMHVGTKTGNEYKYSVKEYAEYILKNADKSEYSGAVTLVKAMLNYGTEAQKYFKMAAPYANDTSYMTDSEKTVTILTTSQLNAPESSTDGLPGGVTFEGSSLSLKSKTTLSLYFKDPDKMITSFACGEMAVEDEELGGYRVARITGINAEDLGKQLTIKVNCGSSSYDVRFGVLNYCSAVLSGGHPELEAVVSALYRYWQEAESFAEQGGGN